LFTQAGKFQVGFGTYKVVGSEAIHKCVDSALAYGYRHFDTAKLYKNEPELGASLEQLLPKYGLRREDIFITTKFFPPAEGAAEKVPQLVEESLTNLRTSYLDLVLIHYPKADERDANDEVGVVGRDRFHRILTFHPSRRTPSTVERPGKHWSPSPATRSTPLECRTTRMGI